jgi:hypothetical protein
MKPFFLFGALSTVACAAGLVTSGTLSTMTPSLTGINAAAPRYTTEQERLVSEIAGSILNIAADADHFEPGDAFQVRTVGVTAGASKFSLARRAEVFTVELPSHVWVPAGYVRLARSFMADGGGMSISSDPAEDRAILPAVLDPDAVARQSARVASLLARHPRSAAIHERTALLLGAAARQAAGVERAALMCRMTAHLAVARALDPDGPASDGRRAEHDLASLAALVPER